VAFFHSGMAYLYALLMDNVGGRLFTTPGDLWAILDDILFI